MATREKEPEWVKQKYRKHQELLASIARDKQKEKDFIGADDYKYLGWQNGWRSVYFDKDGNQVPYNSKEARTFGYLETDYPEYGQCRRLQHKLSRISLSRRGTHEVIKCDICKIWWNLDCGD